MYVFAHLGAPPSAPKCAKGVLYTSAPTYLPGMGGGAAAGTGSSSAWLPLVVGAAVAGGVLWWMARSAAPVLENPRGATKAKWIPENRLFIWKSEISSRKAVGEADWPWLRKHVPTNELSIDAIVWGLDGQQRPELFQTFTADGLNDAKAYAKQLIEEGEAGTVGIRGKYHPQWQREKIAVDFGEVRAVVRHGLTQYELEMLEATSMPGGYKGFGYLAELRSLAKQGYVTQEGDRWIATDKGRTLKNNPLLPNDSYSPFPAEDVDPHELAIGAEHELEHTSDRKVARRIALDHLREDPRYYKKLDEVEGAGLGALFAPNTNWPLMALLIPGVPPLAENPQKPRRTEFEIATRDGGRATRMGYVEGDFATHKERYFWEFTHLPTGLSLSTYPVHETKASALAHLHELATAGPPEHVKRLLERYPGWGGAKPA